MFRHREITSKAVSAILVLVLKWFKASREWSAADALGGADVGLDILKFHYVSQLLFDSNCLLLVLKMFGLSDVFQSVTTQHDSKDDK